MRKTTTLVLTTALLGWTPAPARAQEKPAADATSADAAEEAFLKAYFAEKELKDYAAADKAYAALIATNGASREVLARATLGRARCLRELKRVDEADALFAKVEKDFADVKDVAAEAHAALQASTSKSDGSLDARIRADIAHATWRDDAWKYGERGVPSIVALLRDDSPETVYRAAETLARMESGQAHDALVNVLDGRAPTTYPEQVRNAVESGFASMGAMKRLANVKNAEVRAFALGTLVERSADATAVEMVVADVDLRTKFIAANNSSPNYGRFLVAAVARGGEPRDAALARLRGEPLKTGQIGGLFDPPAPVLADAEAVAAIAPHVAARARSVADNMTPSPALVAAFTRFPETAVMGVQWTLSLKRPSADTSAFVDAVARVGFGDNYSGGLALALGPKPSPDVLRKLASGWPTYRDWEREGQRLPAFLRDLIKSGVTDEPSLLAFQAGLGSEWRLHQQFTQVLQSARPAVGPWAVKAFLYELTLPTDREAHSSAAVALLEWQRTFGDAAGIEAHVPELVAALGLGGSPTITEVLACSRPRSIEALKAALATHPRKAVVAESLATLGDNSSGDAIESALAETSDIEDENRRTEALESAIGALVRVKGDAAKDALALALAAHGGRDAVNVLTYVRRLVEHDLALGAGPRAELCKLAIEKVPGALSGEGSLAEGLPMDLRRELAVLALRATSVQDRQWGASQERELLDVAAWDALLVAAEDQDGNVRDYAREALRLIRAKENEMSEFRAMGEERATRKRIEGLIGSIRPQDRRAGVAAIAATGLAGMVNDLIRLAAEDSDDNVRDDARKALLAMAKPAVAAPQPAAAEKK